jgi:hypothetical protein
MVGISPTITNSVVPMANALMVSASRAMAWRDPGSGEDGSQCAGFTFAEKLVYKPNCFDLRSIMKTTLDELQAFAAVVDTGSITAAAQRLDLTVSAASRTLARLEEKLDHAAAPDHAPARTHRGRAGVPAGRARSSSPSRMPRSRCSRGARCRPGAYASTRRRRSCCT